MKETYRGLVDNQITIHNSNCNPFESGVFYLAREWGEMPIWGLPFSEKPIKLDTEDIFEVIVTDDKRLDDMGVSRRYGNARIEREIITDRNGRDALIERVYYENKTSGCLEPQYASVMYRGDHHYLEPDIWELFVDAVGQPSGPIVYRLKAPNIRSFLRTPIPLVFAEEIID